MSTVNSKSLQSGQGTATTSPAPLAGLVSDPKAWRQLIIRNLDSTNLLIGAYVLPPGQVVELKLQDLDSVRVSSASTTNYTWISI